MKFGSVLAVLGPLAFAVGCSQSDPGITTNVKTKLMADDLVKARNIDVTTREGVVTLTGTVQSATEEAKALEIARGTKGVTDVVDQIAINSASEPGSAPTSGIGDSAAGSVSDAAITAKVKSSLLADTDVGGLRIDVDTRDGIVTLTGAVKTAAEKARAVELAKKIDNVTRVEDRLTVGR